MVRKKVMLFFIMFVVAMFAFAFDKGFLTIANAKDSPKIVLDSYNIVEGTIKMGEQSKIRLKLKNTHESLSAENILLTYESENNSVSSSYGNSNQIFIDSIKAKEVVKKDLDIVVSDKVEGNSIPLKFKLTYVDSKSKTNYDDEFMINLPINSGMNYVKDVELSSSATQNEKTSISVKVNNTGSLSLKDMKMIVKGNVKANDEKDVKSIEDGLEFDLGEVASGKETTFEKNLIFDKIGKNNIEVSFEYKTDEKEKLVEAAGDYYINVIENEGQNAMAELNIAGIEISWVWLICSCLGVVALIVMFILRIRKSEK